MPQQEILMSVGFDTFIRNQKVLHLDGHKAIEYHVYDSDYQGSVFSEENTLLVMINGAIGLRYGKSEHLVSKNQIAFLKNNTMIEYKTGGPAADHGKVEFIFFLLSNALIKEFTKLIQLSSFTHNDTSEIITAMLNNSLQKYIDSIIHYFDDPSKIDGSLTRIKLLELLFCLANSDTKMLDLLLNLKESFRPNITTIVEDNLTNSLSINQLAVLSGRSLSSFRRDFLSIYNMPPSQWIRERRLKKASEFLLTTNMKITDICYTLGFESIAHFSRLFKSQFGHSPTQYRLQPLSA